MTNVVHHVGLIVGRLRRESTNRKLANALVELSPAGLKYFDIPLGDLPMDNGADAAQLASSVVVADSRQRTFRPITRATVHGCSTGPKCPSPSTAIVGVPVRRATLAIVCCCTGGVNVPKTCVSGQRSDDILATALWVNDIATMRASTSGRHFNSTPPSSPGHGAKP
jgi:hypothetical protein